MFNYKTAKEEINTIKFRSFLSEKLEDSDFANSDISFCDFRGANLKNLNLINTRINHCNFGNAYFSNVNCENSTWENVSFLGAKIIETNFHKAVIRNCSLESSFLEKVNLKNGFLTFCNCDNAQFEEVDFLWTKTIGSTFSNSDLTKAKNFFLSKDILVEILKREVNKNDIEALKLLGLYHHNNWCYKEWKNYLIKHPDYWNLVIKIFEKYHYSYAKQALEKGWEYSTSYYKRQEDGNSTISSDGALE